MPKTLVCSGVIREESVLKESDDSKAVIITTVSRGKPSLVLSANGEHGCTVHTAGSALQMKANLVSLCNRELQLDHRSQWNKDRERVKEKRKRKRERKKWRPGPPGQTIAVR